MHEQGLRQEIAVSPRPDPLSLEFILFYPPTAHPVTCLILRVICV